MINKKDKLLISIILLSSVVISLCIYFLPYKKEVYVTSNDIHSIYVGDIPNADEVKRVIEGNIEKFKKEAEIEKTRPPRQPITNLSEIEGDDSGMIQLDSKLLVNQWATLDPEEIRIDYALKDVGLCNEVYKTKQIIIGEVDIIQRLSEILAEDQELSNEYCEGLFSHSELTGGAIKPGDEIRIHLHYIFHTYYYEVDLGVGLANILSGNTPNFLGGSSREVASSPDNLFTVYGHSYKLNKNSEI